MRPCFLPMPEHDTHQFCFVCLWEEHAAIKWTVNLLLLAWITRVLVHSSLDDKAQEELLKVVTLTVTRLQLDWPREQENPKACKEDIFLSGGQGEEPLPFFEDLHDELSRSSGKPYTLCVFVPSTYLTIVGAKALVYMP